MLCNKATHNKSYRHGEEEVFFVTRGRGETIPVCMSFYKTQKDFVLWILVVGQLLAIAMD